MADNDALNAERQVLDIAGRVAGKLNKLVDDGHDTTAFVIVIILAAVKDAADIATTFTLFGFVPVLGQLPGLLLSGILTVFMFRRGWTFFKKTRVRMAWWVIEFFFDNVPGFDALPLTVIFVLIAWRDARRKAAEAKDNLDNLPQKTLAELQEIEAATLVDDDEITEEPTSAEQERAWRRGRAALAGMQQNIEDARMEEEIAGLEAKKIKAEKEEEGKIGGAYEETEEVMGTMTKTGVEKIGEESIAPAAEGELPEPVQRHRDRVQSETGSGPENIPPVGPAEKGPGGAFEERGGRVMGEPGAGTKDISAKQLGGAYAQEEELMGTMTKTGFENIGAEIKAPPLPETDEDVNVDDETGAVDLRKNKSSLIDKIGSVKKIFDERTDNEK